MKIKFASLSLVFFSALLSTPLTFGQSPLLEVDFGTSESFDTAVFRGTPLPTTVDTRGLTSGDTVRFLARPDAITGLTSSGGSALVYWGSHTGFEGTKEFALTSDQLAEGGTIRFALQVGNWYPTRLDFSRPTAYEMRQFKAEIRSGSRLIGTLTGTPASKDQYTTYSLVVDRSELKAGDYSLRFTVQTGGNYAALDTFQVSSQPVASE